MVYFPDCLAILPKKCAAEEHSGDHGSGASVPWDAQDACVVLCLSRSAASSAVPPHAESYARGFVKEMPLLSFTKVPSNCQHMCAVEVVHDMCTEAQMCADLLNLILPAIFTLLPCMS